MCIIAPVSPIGRDDTRAPYKASDPHERERCQLPGIRIEPTFFSQVVLTGRLLSAFGLIPSLFLLPAGLFAGSLGILVWPGLFSTMATRLTDAVLRASVNQSGMEILYLPLSATVKRR